MSKNIRLNFAHFFIMKISRNGELQQITFNHSSDIDFINLCKTCNSKPYLLLAIDANLLLDPSADPSRFRKNILETL